MLDTAIAFARSIPVRITPAFVWMRSHQYTVAAALILIGIIIGYLIS